MHGEHYAVFIGANVSIAHQAQVHGPVLLEDDVYVGMQALVYDATLGEGVIVEPGAIVVGVTIAAGRYVPAGAVVTDQATADALPEIDGHDYPYLAIAERELAVHHKLAAANAGGHGSSASGSTAAPSGGGH